MAAGPSVLQDASWQERAFVTLSKKGASSDIDFHGLMSEMSFSGGAKDVEGQALMNGGRLRQRSAQEDFEWSATLYMTGVSPSEGTGIAEWFHGSSDQKSSKSSVYEYETSLTRDDFRIAVMFTNATTNASGSDLTSATDGVEANSSNKAYRFIATDAQLTEYEQNFDDNVLEVEVTFVITPFDETGASNVREQEYTGDASETLAALTSY